MRTARKTADVIPLRRLTRVTSQAVTARMVDGRPIYSATVVGIYIESMNPAAVESCIQCQEVSR